MHILLAHGDPNQHFTFQKAIQETKTEVSITSVYNGWQLLDHLISSTLEGKKIPDVILSDVDMPVVNGIEVLKQLKVSAHFKNIPVHLFRGNVTEETNEAAGAAGIHETPECSNKLKEIISQILGNYSSN